MWPNMLIRCLYVDFITSGESQAWSPATVFMQCNANQLLAIYYIYLTEMSDRLS